MLKREPRADSPSELMKARKDGLYLMFLGAAVFLLFGLALVKAAPVSTADFRLMYYSARCVLTGHDPYREDELRQTFHEQGGETAQDTALTRKTETQYIYPPASFFVTVPFALLPFKFSQALWLIATAVSLTFAAFLMWEVSSQWAPFLAGALLALTLANCELFLAIAGPGGIAIGCCVVATWCFIRQRCQGMGVFCFAVSLLLKPHDSSLIWLCFFCAGSTYRRRALQVLAAVVGCSCPAVAWTFYVAPHWTREFLANLSANGAHGSLSDPGVSSTAGHGIAMIVSLQTVFSFFYDSPGFYNWASYLVCAVLLVLWAARVRRGVPDAEDSWFAVAPVAALSMLPVYHRLDDAKVLLLVVPACALLWRRGIAKSWLAVAITTAQIILTCAIPWALFLTLTRRLPAPNSKLGREFLIAAQVMPAPLILLASAIYYLWIYYSTAQVSKPKATADGVHLYSETVLDDAP